MLENVEALRRKVGPVNMTRAKNVEPQKTNISQKDYVTDAIAVPAMSESDLLATILDMAQKFGWRTHHTYDSHKAPRGRKGQLRTNPGFPDIALAKHGQVIYTELKTEKGRVSEDQDWWLDVLGLAVPKTFVWRPEQLDSGEIERILRGEYAKPV